MIDDDVIVEVNPCAITPLSSSKGSSIMKGKTLLSPLKDSTNVDKSTVPKKKQLSTTTTTTTATMMMNSETENADCKMQ